MEKGDPKSINRSIRLREKRNFGIENGSIIVCVNDEEALIKEFEKEIVNKGKGNPRFIHTLNELINVKKKYKTKKDPFNFCYCSFKFSLCFGSN